jgi:hypothetical protein
LAELEELSCRPLPELEVEVEVVVVEAVVVELAVDNWVVDRILHSRALGALAADNLEEDTRLHSHPAPADKCRMPQQAKRLTGSNESSSTSTTFGISNCFNVNTKWKAK